MSNMKRNTKLIIKLTGLIMKAIQQYHEAHTFI